MYLKDAIFCVVRSKIVAGSCSDAKRYKNGLETTGKWQRIMLKRPFAQSINPSLAWKSFKTWDNIKRKWEAGNIRRKWKVFQPERKGWNLCGYA